MQRSTPWRVLTEPCVAISCGVPLRRNPPSPVFSDLSDWVLKETDAPSRHDADAAQAVAAHLRQGDVDVVGPGQVARGAHERVVVQHVQDAGHRNQDERRGEAVRAEEREQRE